jgi:hypothetical protein
MMHRLRETVWDGRADSGYFIYTSRPIICVCILRSEFSLSSVTVIRQQGSKKAWRYWRLDNPVPAAAAQFRHTETRQFSFQ